MRHILKKLYWDEKKSIRKIAKELSFSYGKIQGLFDEGQKPSQQCLDAIATEATKKLTREFLKKEYVEKLKTGIEVWETRSRNSWMERRTFASI